MEEFLFSGTHRVASFAVASSYATHLHLFARFEYQHIGHQVVEYARDEQGGQVTVDHIPLENLLEDEQEYHLDEEPGSRREIEYHKTQEEIACGAVSHPAFPYPEIGAHEIAQHGKLKADGRREYVFAEVAAEYEMVTYPQHKRVDPCTKQATDHELQIDAQFQYSSFHGPLRFLFLEGFQRVLLCQQATVGNKLYQPGDEEKAGDKEARDVEQTQCLAADSPFKVFERRVDEHGVDEDNDQSQFGGPQLAIGEQEFPFDDG